MLIQLMVMAMWAVCERYICSVEQVDSSAGLAADGTTGGLEHCWKLVIVLTDNSFCVV